MHIRPYRTIIQDERGTRIPRGEALARVGRVGGELCGRPWTESKIERGHDVSLLFKETSRISIREAPPVPLPPPPKYRQNDGSRRGGRGWGRAGNGGTVVFPKLGRKFAQLNGARCLPLVPLIVHESTTGVESKNKGNTSLVRLFFPHHARALLRRSSTLLLSPPPPLPSPPTQLG